MHQQPTLSIFTRKMNATDYTTAVSDDKSREFIISIMILIGMAVAGILFVFHDIHETHDPCYQVTSRLDVLIRYWPILIVSAVCYGLYKIVEGIALHTCCRPQQPTIIARPLKSFDRVP